VVKNLADGAGAVGEDEQNYEEHDGGAQLD
jgi:hypothetical protein